MISTVATPAGKTVMVEIPLLLPLAAVMIAVPAPFAVTRPDDDTEATPAADDDHASGRPERRFPASSFTAALSCTFSPTMRVADAGVTSMVATAGGSDEPLHAAMNRPMRSQQRASHAPVAEAVDRTRSSPLM